MLWTFEEDSWLPSRKSFKVVQKKFRLFTINQTTPSSLIKMKIAQRQFDEAHAIAQKYGIVADSIFQVSFFFSPFFSSLLYLILKNK